MSLKISRAGLERNHESALNENTRLRAELEQAQQELKFMADCTVSYLGSLSKAEQRELALRDNDRRYRWLWPRLAMLERRGNSDGSTSYRFNGLVDDVLGMGPEPIWYASLDMAIDETSGFSGEGSGPAAAATPEKEQG